MLERFGREVSRLITKEPTADRSLGQAVCVFCGNSTYGSIDVLDAEVGPSAPAPNPSAAYVRKTLRKTRRSVERVGP